MSNAYRCMSISLLAVTVPAWGCLAADDPGADEAEAASAVTAAPLDGHAFVDASHGAWLAPRARAAEVVRPDAGTTSEVFAIGNLTATPINPFGSFTLSPAPGFPATPLPFGIAPSTAQVVGVTVPASLSWSQVIQYTTNSADPFGNAKSCTWLVTTTFNGTCTGNVSSTALGNQGALCGFDPSQSFVDPTTCQAQVFWLIQ